MSEAAAEQGLPQGVDKKVESILNRRVSRRGVIGAAAVAAGAVAADVATGGRLHRFLGILRGKSGEATLSANVGGEHSEAVGIKSFNQLKSVVGEMSVEADSQSQDLKKGVLTKVDNLASIQENVDRFVDSYQNHKDADGQPTLRKLVRQQLFDLDLKPLLEGQTRYKSEDELLDDQFFFMRHKRYLGLDLDSTNAVLSQIKAKGVVGSTAFSQLGDVLDRSITSDAVLKDGSYTLSREAGGKKVTFDTRAVGASLSSNGTNIDQDKREISAAISNLPQVGNTRVEIVDKGPLDTRGDVGGVSDYDDKTREAVIRINRNTPDLKRLVLHERAHNLDVAAPKNILQHYNAPDAVIETEIARYRAQASSHIVSAVDPNRPLLDSVILPRDEHYAFALGEKAKIATYSQVDAARLTQETFNRLTDKDVETFAWTLTDVASGNVKAHGPLEIARFGDYINSLEAF